MKLLLNNRILKARYLYIPESEIVAANPAKREAKNPKNLPRNNGEKSN